MENDYNMYFAAIKRTKKKKQKAIRSESMEKLLMAEHHLTTLTKENELKWVSGKEK
jgi:GH35 family endo-1,4-beta-xylanase